MDKETTHIKCWSAGNDQNSVLFSSFNGKYDDKTEKFGMDGSRVNVDQLVMYCDLEQLSYDEIQDMIYFKSEDNIFRDSLRIYTSYIHKTFRQQIISKKKYLKCNYKLLIHMITNPNSIQLWRRINVNGRINMKQFDNILRDSFHFGTHSSWFKIPLNNKHFNIKQHDSKYIKSEILLYHGIEESIDNFCFAHLYKDFSYPINELLFGQIASIFYHENNNKNTNKIPFDQFKQNLYPGLYANYSMTEKKRIFDFNARFDNYNLNRNDCIKWCYDVGDQYIFNIYVESIDDISKQRNKNKRDIVWCEYLNGSTCQPPTDIGGFQDWFGNILLCHGYSLNEINVTPLFLANEYKNKRSFYEWLKKTYPSYYNVFCLGKSSVYLSYFEMNKAKFNNYMKEITFKMESSMHTKLKKKQIIKNIKNENKPFYCPYLPIDAGVHSILCKLNDKLRKMNKNKKLRIMRCNILKLKYCVFCKCVNVKLKLCGQCRNKHYCSRKCQKHSWLTHRYECYNYSV